MSRATDEAGYRLQAGARVSLMRNEHRAQLHARLRAAARAPALRRLDQRCRAGTHERRPGARPGSCPERYRVAHRQAPDRQPLRRAQWSSSCRGSSPARHRLAPGVRVGRRIDQAPSLPQFVHEERTAGALVREFLGGLFGADGHAPILHPWGAGDEAVTLAPPAYSQSAEPEFASADQSMRRHSCGCWSAVA